jgi:hypothetical protein
VAGSVWVGGLVTVAVVARTVHAGATRAVALRGTIGLITLATVFLAAVLAT